MSETTTVTEVIIQKAEEDDAAAIAVLLRQLGWFTHFDTASAQDTADRVGCHMALCNADDSHSIYVAKNRVGDLVGYASIHWLPYMFLTGIEGYLSELFVAEHYRGKAVGRLLLEHIKTEAKDRGCSRLMLVTSRNRESYQRGFYAKQGWREREEVANFVCDLG